MLQHQGVMRHRRTGIMQYEDASNKETKSALLDVTCNEIPQKMV